LFNRDPTVFKRILLLFHPTILLWGKAYSVRPYNCSMIFKWSTWLVGFPSNVLCLSKAIMSLSLSARAIKPSFHYCFSCCCCCYCCCCRKSISGPFTAHSLTHLQSTLYVSVQGVLKWKILTLQNWIENMTKFPHFLFIYIVNFNFESAFF